MEPVLIDTSVWINFFNGKVNTQTNLVKEYLEREYITEYYLIRKAA